MTFRPSSSCVCLTAVAILIWITPNSKAQNAEPSIQLGIAPHLTLAASTDLPEAPQPQEPPAPTTGTSSSAEQAPSDAEKKPGATQAKTQEQIAEEQLKEQQKQRILGVVPNFNTSYVYGAASLTAKQKFKLAFRSAIDPVQIFGVAPFVALIGQANADHYGYGGGVQGYAKRYGQTFADNFDGTILGNAFFPSLLHQDPRYFRLGRGSIKRRIFYALGTNVLARHDHTGKWEPNYSNILGNLASGGISNLYLPKDERGFVSTVTGGLTVTIEGGFGSMFQEFWPDIARHTIHKDPTHGQDAINRSQPDPTGGGNPFSNRVYNEKKRKEKAEKKAAATRP